MAEMTSSRYQDLTRQEAYGLEARALLRMAPLLIIRNGADRSRVSSFLSNYFDFAHKLAAVALGNSSPEDAVAIGKKYHESLNAPGVFEEKSAPAVESVLLATDALGELNLVRYIPKTGIRESDMVNSDVGMIIAHGGWTLSNIGMQIGDLHRARKPRLRLHTE